ncbi:MAG: iron-sulfur cluster assembly scaffold protein [Candidatus Anstonellales archaeon]
MMDLYKDDFIAIYKNPMKYGKLDHYTHVLEGNNGSCGDNIKIYLKIDDQGKIGRVSFEGHGCVISIVSTSLLLSYLEGKHVDLLKELGEQDMYELVGIDLSDNPSRKKCMMLALDTLKKLTSPHP